ncbi:hypothetical protein [Myxococcus sp. CA040A]|uniref:hypothetical protein n=1 Tax=Myxococcus sp. CA040A TaxID=2741738 RepID=UPI00157B4A69|nr:hypothetical protein [Myxococcus sp. CA040A]NTX02417.1 hypothetical protein [Myxococcus sp. CA040A]
MHPLSKLRKRLFSYVPKTGALPFELSTRDDFDRWVQRAVLDAVYTSDDERWDGYGITAATEPSHSSFPSMDNPLFPTSDRQAFEKLREVMWGPAVEAKPLRLSILGSAYGVTVEQLDAVGWYTSPQAGWCGGNVPKTDDDAEGQEHVARALTEAMRALPSMRDLGLQLPVFRVIGCAEGEKQASQISHLKEGTVIIHGARPMKNKSNHFMSTSITPNLKGFSVNLPMAGEVLAIYGSSGRYIQWLGRHGFSMDGGEVLYPPGTVTRFLGQVAAITVGERENVPVYMLVECDPSEVTSKTTVVDDFKFGEPPGSLDLARLREKYATTGRAVEPFDFSERDLMQRTSNILKGLTASGSPVATEGHARDLAQSNPGLRYRGGKSG